MKLSVVIPACNEEGQIEETVRTLHSVLSNSKIEKEILVINDNSKDNTKNILKKVCTELPHVRYLNNKGPNNFGFAVRCGLENFNGDAVAIYMADGSDLPEDVVRFFKKLEEDYDCVFGSRFVKGGKAIDYPLIKLVLNRLANLFISLIFQMRYNDTTNAFKMYRRHVIRVCDKFMGSI